MSMSVPPAVEARVRQNVASGLYANADEAIQTAVLLRDEWDRAHYLRASLIEAEEQTRSGNDAEWTPELQRRLMEQAKAMAEQGIAPDPDACQ